MWHGRHLHRGRFLGHKFALWLSMASVLIFVNAPGCVIEPRIYRIPKPVQVVKQRLEAMPVPTPKPAHVSTETASGSVCSAATTELTMQQGLSRAGTTLAQGNEQWFLDRQRSAAQAYRHSLGQTAWLLERLKLSQLTGGCPAPRQTLMAQRIAWVHNQALLGLLRSVGCKPGCEGSKVKNRLAELGVMVQAEPHLAEIGWDELWPVADFMTTHVQDPCRTEGLGVPLVLSRNKRPRVNYPERSYPPHWKYAATALVRPAEGASEDGPLNLVLIDPYRTNQVVHGHLTWPMATDLTTPVIHLLSHSQYRHKALTGLFIPEKLTDEEGITTVHPYQPGKIPIVLIHGLGCSPRIMADIVNSIHANPALRSRYQVFVAYYTTGDTILQDAQKLREAISGTRQYYDPQHTDQAWDQMVVLGHSLGGPIARILTTHSDDFVEQAIFNVPLDSIRLSEISRAQINRSIHFEPVPEIKRVVYLCGTMKGSTLADQVEGRILSRIIPRRSALEAFHHEVLTQNGPLVLNPRFQRRPPSSIDNQSPKSVILKAINQLRRSPDVAIHSIQANATPVLTVPASSDLLVSFKSSYIDEASSRLVVQGVNHFCTHEPDVLAEIERILLLHLESTDSNHIVETPVAVSLTEEV